MSFKSILTNIANFPIVKEASVLSDDRGEEARPDVFSNLLTTDTIEIISDTCEQGAHNDDYHPLEDQFVKFAPC